MYSKEERIRFSEVGPDGRLTLPALVNYFQDCSTFHSEDVGVGLPYLSQRNCAWLMSFWQVSVDSYPRLGETVQVETRPYAFEHFFGRRNFAMRDAQGRILAKADSLWLYYNAVKGRPERPPREMVEAYILTFVACGPESAHIRLTAPDGTSRNIVGDFRDSYKAAADFVNALPDPDF